MDTCRPHTRRKAATHRKRAANQDGSPFPGETQPFSKRRISSSSQAHAFSDHGSRGVGSTLMSSPKILLSGTNDGSHEESMITSTRCPEVHLSKALRGADDISNLSPILPSIVQDTRLQEAATQKKLHFDSSPCVLKEKEEDGSGRDPGGRSHHSDVHFLSGDDDLFQWDEDDFQGSEQAGGGEPVEPAKPPLKRASVSGCSVKQTSTDQTNCGQNHDRILPSDCQMRDLNAFQDSCDLWDGDDSLYAQIDISRIVRDAQNVQHAAGPTDNATVRQGSGQHSLDGVSNDFTKAGSTSKSSGDGGAIDRKSFDEMMDVPSFSAQDLKSAGVDQEVAMKCSEPVHAVPVNAIVGKDKMHQADQCSNQKTPRNEKWFSNLNDRAGKSESCNVDEGFNDRTPDRKDAHLQSQSLRENKMPIPPKKKPVAQEVSSEQASRQHTSVLSTSFAGGHLVTPDRRPLGQAPVKRTPGTTPGSRLRDKLHRNAKAVTTPPAGRAQQQQRSAAVQQALTEMAHVGSATGERDIGPFYGLPSRVRELLGKQRGITKLYTWQEECLAHPALREGHNLVFSLPTSGGKTLVAEIIIMQQLLCHHRDALLILPFVSIVQEKVTSLSPLAVEMGFLVEEYAGSKGSIPPRKRLKKHALYVCTIEKAHTLVNCLIQEARIGEIGLVVVDELHMIGEGGRRGASLEICLSKLLHLETCQLLGMSATLSNLGDLCHFLRADVYTNDFRPVDLKEYIKLEDHIFHVNPGINLVEDEKFTHARTVAFPYSKVMLKNDPDHLVGLALEVIPTNSCLVFCATKKNCQNVAETICRYIPRELSKRLFQHKQAEKNNLLTALVRECDGNLCPTLRRTVPYGAAYHHGGLTMDERKLIEDAYSEGTLCLLAATSTLAAGVNLPAKRVILRSPYIATQLLTTSRYKQMVGRAGRAGKDTTGESILIVKPKDRQAVAELLSGPMEGCFSSLMHDEGKGMRSLVLSLISLKITPTEGSLQEFIKNTLCGIQATEFQRDLIDLSQDALQQVIYLDLVMREQNGVTLEVTRLGHAAFKGSIDLDVCSTLYEDLRVGCDKGLVLANSLHLLYLVTPYDQIDSARPNWAIYMRQFSILSDAEHKVAELVGVSEFYMQCKMTGRSSKNFTPALERRTHRFYLTLILWDILKRKNIWEVAARFEAPRGFVQSLFTSAASFAFSVQRFCEDLPEFWAVHQLLSKLVYDLTYCATADLAPLLEISGVKQGRAKQLVKAGYKTLRHLAHADPQELVSKVDHLPTKVAQQIVAAAKMALAERIEALKEEAEELDSKPTATETT